MTGPCSLFRGFLARLYRFLKSPNVPADIDEYITRFLIPTRALSGEYGHARLELHGSITHLTNLLHCGFDASASRILQRLNFENECGHGVFVFVTLLARRPPQMGKR